MYVFEKLVFPPSIDQFKRPQVTLQLPAACCCPLHVGCFLFLVACACCLLWLQPLLLLTMLMLLGVI